MTTTTEQRAPTDHGADVGERPTSGISQLLRVARTECASAFSFVALSAGGVHVDTASPGSHAGLDRTSPGSLTAPGSPPPPGTDLVDELVRRLRTDPAIARGKALIRTLPLDPGVPGAPPRRLAVAVVPLGADGTGRPRGFLGVADPDVKAFGVAALERLTPVARRVSSYVAARQVVRRQMGAAIPTPPVGAAAPASPGIPAPPGLVAPRVLLDRARRLLGSGAQGGSLVVVALDVSGAPGPAEWAAGIVVRALRAELRFDDPVARLDETGFLAVVPLGPGAPDPAAVAARLAAAVHAALGGAAAVRSAHVQAGLAAQADAVELVREVAGRLRRDEPGAPRAR